MIILVRSESADPHPTVLLVCASTPTVRSGPYLSPSDLRSDSLPPTTYKLFNARIVLLNTPFVFRNKMAGSAGHSFVDCDGGSDNETLESFDEHEVSEDGLLLHYDDSNHVVNNDLNLMIPSVEGLVVESSESLEPYTGMTFPSLDDARNFYYEYARRTGFTIRTNRIRHSLKNMAIIGRDFVCSREGFRATKHTLRKDRVLPPRPITREGCKAMIRLAARDGSKWVVTKFVRDHNHKLMTHCKFPGELPIVNILSEEEKDKKIQDLYDELQRERERSAAVQQQLHMVLKDLEEHAEFMSIRVEDIVNRLKEIELDGL